MTRFRILLLLCFVAGAAGIVAHERAAPARAERPSAPQSDPGRAESRSAARESAAVRAGPAEAEPGSGQAPIELDPSKSQAELSLRLRRWAARDPAGFLEAFEALAGSPRLLQRGTGPLVDALRLAAEVDPLAVLALGERHAGTLGVLLRSTALEMLAVSEPAAALRWLDDVDSGDPRERYLAAIATGYARADLERAVAWLTSLGAGDGAAVYPIIDAVALVDLSRAIELDLGAIERDLGGLGFGSTTWLRTGLMTNRYSPARIADRLAALKSNGLLADALGWWATRDPYGAVAWIQSQPTISRLALERLAGELGRQDYVFALSLADQFASAVKTPWIGAVLGSAAEVDVVGGLASLESWRGEPFFDDVHRRLLLAATADLGPIEAARIAGTAPPRGVASAIVSGWIRIDPEGAASWALALEDSNERARAISTLVSAWTDADVAAADAWLRRHEADGLPEGTITVFCARTGRC